MTKTEFAEMAISKMFEMAGYDPNKVEEFVKEDEWYSKYSMTEEVEAEWEKWFIKASVNNKIFRNKKAARMEFNWFNLSYGLTTSIKTQQDDN